MILRMTIIASHAYAGPSDEATPDAAELCTSDSSWASTVEQASA